MPSAPEAEQSALVWTIIVPLKALPAAKTRLQEASPDPQAHAALVNAIRADTLSAAGRVGRLLLVVDREGAAVTSDGSRGDPASHARVERIVQSAAGLNSALAEAAVYASARWPTAGIAALVGDLPAMREDELATAIGLAAAHDRAFVDDASGLGTTLLTALPGFTLEPRFGPDSARRHALIASRLPAGPGLRLDVDTAEDLVQARGLGLGPSTRAVLGW